MKKHLGFTLIEVLLVVTIAGILASVAVPAIGEFIKNNKVKSHMYNLLNSMNQARTEAVKRKAITTMCRVADSSVATPVCGSSAANTWTNGWIIFEDVDGDGVYEPGAAAPNGPDLMITRAPAANDPITIIANSISNQNLQYKGDGTLHETGIARFAICDNRSPKEDYGRQVNVAMVGRASIYSAPIDSCTAPTGP